MLYNYFRATPNKPSHLSVGAVLINKKHKICCHYFDEFKGLKNFYILMRETPHPNETLEQTLYRGILEEFGAKAKIITFIDTLTSNFDVKNFWVRKTTLYFLCKLIAINKNWRDKKDGESVSKIEWRDIDFLIAKMKKQSLKLTRTDLDESVILEKVKKYLEKK